MSYQSRKEYIEQMQQRYQQKGAGRCYKTQLLDEVCQVCEYNRKYAIKLLGGSVKRSSKKRGRKSYYGSPELLRALTNIWHAAGQMCSKRLMPELSIWLKHYDLHYTPISQETRSRLLDLSAATADRLLAPVKARCNRSRNSGTKPGSILKAQIPIRTDNADITRPGYLEADTVAHCGGSMSGSFIHSVTYVDIITGWTAQRAVWNKGYAGVMEQTKDVEKKLPFEILGFDSDNGNEFLNWHLARYFMERDSPVGFTRSRAYHKNDNAHVEQKNYTHVRQLLGYDRLDNPALLELVNQLYLIWEKYNNFFCPCMKLQVKERHKSRVYKKHDKAKTPYQRLLDSKILSAEKRAALKKEFESLDPYVLKKQIDKKLKMIEQIKKEGLSSPVPSKALVSSPA